MDDRCFNWSLFCNCMATGSCVHVRVSDVSWLKWMNANQWVDNWMTDVSIEVCFATSSWQLAAVYSSVSRSFLLFHHAWMLLGPHEFLFVVKLLFLSYLKQNCELQEPFTVFMQACFDNTAGHVCIPSGNRVPDLLKERVFTDHTLAHPLNCRGGVVARLSA